MINTPHWGFLPGQFVSKSFMTGPSGRLLLHVVCVKYKCEVAFQPSGKTLNTVINNCPQHVNLRTV